jgi:hypothetical protein
MKNRKRESCTSGTVRDEDGNILIYSARHDRPIHAAWRPASEKRQGTKSREGTAVVPRALWGFCRGLKRMSFEGQLRRERCCRVT